MQDRGSRIDKFFLLIILSILHINILITNKENVDI